ncbi:DUF397 domain-containing protein [Nocardia sp. NPDC051787]|uniref:DUF397 domain-containing protein n=1 Tax=Nocardia sp. NPDC051787 TaxID=3155415 RepID=UPI003428BFAA
MNVGRVTGRFKSSHSSDSQACVEVCFAGNRVLVRDSEFMAYRLLGRSWLAHPPSGPYSQRRFEQPNSHS